MPGLRRVPIPRDDVDTAPLIPLGVVSLGFDDLRELESLLKRRNNGVRIYAGQGLAPHGVDDLDDATRTELRDVKFVSTKPNITVRLGDDGAYILQESRTGKAAVLTEQVRTFFEGRTAEMISFSIARSSLLWCGLWHLSNIAANAIQVANPSRLPVWALNIIATANVVGIAGILVSFFHLDSRLRRRGAAFIRPVRRRFAVRWLRWIPAVLRFQLLVASSMVAEVVIGYFFFQWDVLPF